MKYFLLGYFSLLFVSCASSTGVLKLGPDTYKMSSRYSPARGGDAAAEVDVLSTANSYCEKMGKELLVKNTEKRSFAPADAGFEAIFQCLNKNDAGLIRPSYEQAPAVVIKNEIRGP